MSRIEGLLKAYEAFVAQPWPGNLAGAEKVWFALYDPAQERRLLFRIAGFETAPRKRDMAGDIWISLTISPSGWRSRSIVMPISRTRRRWSWRSRTMPRPLQRT